MAAITSVALFLPGNKVYLKEASGVHSRSDVASPQASLKRPSRLGTLRNKLTGTPLGGEMGFAGIASPSLRGNSPAVSCTLQSSGAGSAVQEGQDARLGELFGGVDVVSTSGERRPVVELWRDRRAVVAWARHFGCLLCKKRASELTARQEEFKRAGVALVLIGPGTADQARTFKELTGFSGEIYADPTSDTFKALGFVSGFSSVLNAESGLRLVGAMLQGFSQDWGLSLQKDTVLKGAWQQGGTMVAGPGVDALVYLHKDKQAGDEPDLNEVIKACQTPS